ncbi:MAG: tetratricopeptide repeat protein [bacterium]
MKRSVYFILLGLAGLISACGPSQKKMEGNITSMEERLFSSENGFSRAEGDSLIQLYQDYVNRYPGDSLAPGYLFKAATMLMNLQQGKKAVGLFAKFRATYPDHRNAPLCLFFTGYVQENIFGELGKAKATYTLFLKTYPNHDFADDAQASIDNLGKSPEEMIRQFEAKKDTVLP